MNAPKPPLFTFIFISMFGFIGLAVLISLWSASWDDFGSPPLIFRLVGSFIAIAFMAVGFGTPIQALRRRGGGGGNGSIQFPGFSSGDRQGRSEAGPDAGYKCPHCGAGLAEQETSPSGDVKCSYCRKWWNIHQAG